MDCVSSPLSGDMQIHSSVVTGECHSHPAVGYSEAGHSACSVEALLLWTDRDFCQRGEIPAYF